MIENASRLIEPEPLYLAPEVARLLRLRLATVYERARQHPEELGAVRIGRTVRFRRGVIDALAVGDRRASGGSA